MRERAGTRGERKGEGGIERSEWLRLLRYHLNRRSSEDVRSVDRGCGRD